MRSHIAIATGLLVLGAGGPAARAGGGLLGLDLGLSLDSAVESCVALCGDRATCAALDAAGLLDVDADAELDLEGLVECVSACSALAALDACVALAAADLLCCESTSGGVGVDLDVDREVDVDLELARCGALCATVDLDAASCVDLSTHGLIDCGAGGGGQDGEPEPDGDCPPDDGGDHDHGDDRGGCYGSDCAHAEANLDAGATGAGGCAAGGSTGGALAGLLFAALALLRRRP
jgi:hypothetical protein